MRNNKGLSDVVSNVLIILIVVAAVAILGLIVINLVKSAGGGVTSQALCQTLDVQASCTKNATGATATLIRGSGDASVVINDAKLSFVRAVDGTTVSANTTVSSTSAFGIGQTVSGNSTGSFEKVIPIVSGTDADGKAFTCALTQKEASCN